MRGGHAECLQDCRERIQAPGQLREAMLHEAVPNDQSQWDRGPAGDLRSADQIDGKVAPCWRPFLAVACRFHSQSPSRWEIHLHLRVRDLPVRGLSPTDLLMRRTAMQFILRICTSINTACTAIREMYYSRPPQ